MGVVLLYVQAGMSNQHIFLSFHHFCLHFTTFYMLFEVMRKPISVTIWHRRLWDIRQPHYLEHHDYANLMELEKKEFRTRIGPSAI